jgi:formate dehydrogenase maturation protein FdhE
MTAAYHGDSCPVCGSYQVTPYAVILGAREEYGYHCQACQITWRVLVCDGNLPAASMKSPAA